MRKICIILFIFLATIVATNKVWAVSFGDFKEIILTVGNKEIAIIDQEEISLWLDKIPYLKRTLGYRSEIETTEYCPVNKIFCLLTKRQNYYYAFKKKEKFIIKDYKIKLFLEDLARKINKDPIDATFKVVDGKVATASKEQAGVKLDIDASLNKIRKNINKQGLLISKIELVATFIPPEIKFGDAKKMGIVELIGEGYSNFGGSTTSRIHNIQVALSRFDGLLLKPGEEFSFVENLGPVDGEHGYKEELVIKNNKTEPEFGGGICQVSSTVFRAAIYSGLKITARKNHAYPVHYYNPQGIDATIYIPRPDLRFINNTGKYILVQSKIDIPKKDLTFLFYGTKDGRKVEVDGPHILSREDDGSMKTVFTQKAWNKKGELIVDDIFKSNYKSPSLFPHPGEEKFTKKPEGWSKQQWKKYKKENGI